MNAYPQATDMIEICESPHFDEMWEVCRRNPDVEKTVNSLARMVPVGIMLSPNADQQNVELLQKASAQIHTDDFRKYVAAKLGLV